jgi:hypothetical protein
VCKNIGYLSVEKNVGMRLSKEWNSSEIASYSDNRKQQLTSLRKKIFDHKEIAGHKAAVKITGEGKKETLETVCLQSLTREKEIPIKYFVLHIRWQKLSVFVILKQVDLQELNGIDMGRILHSTNACINIVNHIGNEMRTTLIRKIIDSKSKFSLILDESTTVSLKYVLIVYVRTYIQEIDMQDPVNLIIDLIELEDTTANWIYRSLVSRIESLGLTEGFLKENLVSLTCDGAAVMLGSRGGVAKLLKDKFPAIIIWH